MSGVALPHAPYLTSIYETWYIIKVTVEIIVFFLFVFLKRRIALCFLAALQLLHSFVIPLFDEREKRTKRQVSERK